MKASRVRTLLKRIAGAHLSGQRRGLNVRRRPLHLEHLEDRLAPAQVTWTGGGDRTSWNDPLNWSGHQLPGGGGDVTINDPSTIRVVHSTGTDTINSLASQNDLTLSGGSLTIATASTLGANFTFSNGVLAGAGNITITGMLNWSGGTMTGPGSTTAQGGMALSGNPKSLDGRSLTNPGTATWTAGDLNLDRGAVLTNTGLLDDQGGGSLNWTFGAAPSVVNTGTLRVQASTTPSVNTLISVPLTSTSLVDVHGGGLHLSGGGTLGGTLQGSSGTSLFLDGGTFSFPAGSQLLFPDVVFSGATADVRGTYDATNSTQVRGGIANFDAGITLTSLGQALTLSGGTLNLLTGAPLTLPALTMSNGVLTAPSDLTVAGLLSWSGGTMQGAGTTTAQGGMALSGSTRTLDGRSLTNPGTATWTAGDLNLDRGAVLTNTGLLDDQGGGSLNWTFGAAPSVVNTGTLRVQASTTPSVNTIISTSLTNFGTLNLLGGTLSLTTGLTNFVSHALTGGTYLLSGLLRIPGADIATNAATVVLSGANAGIVNSSNNHDALANLANNAAGASLTLLGGRHLTTSGALANAGSLMLDANGLLTVGGGYTQAAGGSLSLGLGGTTPGQGFGQLLASGTVTLDGTLTIDRVPGYFPSNSDSFAVVAGQSLAGAFAAISGLQLSPTLQLSPVYGPSSLVLTAQGVAVNHPPVAVDDTATTLANAPITINVLANDSDPDNDPLTIQSVTTTGTAGSVAIDPGHLTLTYTPAAGFAGTDTFRYTVTDGRGGSASANVTVTVLAADLQVTSFTVPTGLRVGNPVQLPVSWTVTNQGTAGTNVSQWADRVVLSTDQTLDNADDVVIGQFTHTGALGPAGSATAGYTATASVTLPANLTGTFYLFVTADAQGGVTDEVNPSNNSAGPLAITVTPPYADLIVEAVGAPADANCGDPITVSWRVRNQGIAATTAGSWTDRVLISANPTLDSSAVQLAQVTHSGNLTVGGANDTYTAQATVNVPNGISGTFYLFVVADSGNQVYEYTFKNNNTGRTLAPLIVHPVPLPDLALTGVSGPAAGQPGQTVTVHWTEANVGPADARGPWNDRVYLSADGTLNNATLLATAAHSGNLQAGTSEDRSAGVTLPSLPDGSYRFVIVTDADNTVFESDETNNLLASTSPIQLGHPQLQARITSAPATATTGDTVTVQWAVTNHGTADANGTWVDRLYLSTTDTLDSSARLLAEVTHAGTLAAITSYPAQAVVPLPQDLHGPLFFLVRADAADQVGPASSAKLATAGVQVQLAPYADLMAGNVTLSPALAVGDPAHITVGWTVTNHGTGTGTATTWNDAVIASQSGIVGNPDNVILGTFAHTGALAVGASYTQTQSIQLPPAFTGRYHLLVQTDAGNQVFENGN